MIVKTFIGKHIDLSKVVSVSDAYFIDRMGSGGWYVGFSIHIQLLDNPIKYVRELTEDEYIFDRKYIMLYGRDGKTPLAIEKLQVQIDGLIEQWKATK